MDAMCVGDIARVGEGEGERDAFSYHGEHAAETKYRDCEQCVCPDNRRVCNKSRCKTIGCVDGPISIGLETDVGGHDSADGRLCQSRINTYARGLWSGAKRGAVPECCLAGMRAATTEDESCAEAWTCICMKAVWTSVGLPKWLVYIRHIGISLSRGTPPGPLFASLKVLL